MFPGWNRKINILTQQYAWKEQFAKFERHNFFYSDIHCTPLELKELCLSNKIDLVLCLDYQLQSKFSSEHRDEFFALNIPWLLPTYAASEMEDKFKFHAWMYKNNWSHCLPGKRHITDYPYVLRIGNGYSAKYVFLIRHEAELNALDFDIDTGKYICQEYILGSEEYAYHFIAVNGDIVKQTTYKHFFSELIQDQYYIRGRGFFNTSIQSVVLDPEHDQILRAVIKAIAFTGVGCIDFKIHNQHLYILELNTRMGGSLIFFDAILRDLDAYLNEMIHINKLLSS